MIAAWAQRYIEPEAAAAPEAGMGPRRVVVQETRASKFQQTVTVGPHQMVADEPVAAGGKDSGPGPYDFVLAGLGACTSMTMRMYADRKSLPLDRVTVTLKHGKIHASDCEECETREGMLDQIERRHRDRGQPRCRAAQAADGDCRQVPGAPHADVGNPDRDQGRGLMPRADVKRWGPPRGERPSFAYRSGNLP